MHKVTSLFLVPALFGCSGLPDNIVSVPNTLSGVVFKGAVAESTVTVRRLGTDEILATAVTAADGRFEVQMAAEGDLLVCASGGRFVEEATAVQVELPGEALCVGAFGVQLGEDRQVLLTPWTHLAVARAESLVKVYGAEPAKAHAQAWTEWNEFLSCSDSALDIMGAEPVDPTLEGAPTELTPRLQSGLLLAGLTYQARLISESLGITPGTRVNGFTLMQAYAKDLSDGSLDGIGPAGPIWLQSYEISADSMRGAPLGFVHGIREFLRSDRNLTTITDEDVSDLLKCLAEHGGPLFGGEAGVFDGEPPEIEIVSPEEDAILNSTVTIVARATDDSEVASLSVWGDPAFVVDVDVHLGDPNELTARLEIASVDDGPLTLQIEAIDIHGNHALTERHVVINKGAPVITLRLPGQGVHQCGVSAALQCVSGVVAIEATATDPNGIEELVIVRPPLLEATMDYSEMVVRAEWDTTTLHLDREEAIEVRATDSLGNRSTLTQVVRTDNYQKGQANGRVFLDTPVYDVNVEVLPFAGSLRGEPFQRVEAGDGRFSLALPDDYAGPLLLRAFGTSAHYTDAATGVEVEFENETELLLLLDYAPFSAQGGLILNNLSVNAATTLAVPLASYLVDQGVEPQAAIAQAHRLLGRHLERTIRPDGIAIRYTPVGSWLDAPSTAEDQQLLGLFHVGLSRWGAEGCINSGYLKHCRHTLKLLSFFRQDLEDGCFNGLGREGTPIWVISPDRLPLDADTLRVRLASAISRWLDNVPLPDGQGNETGVTSAPFAVAGGFFDALSTSSGALFCDAPGVPFDRAPPEVSVHLENAQGATLPLDRPVSGTVVLVVRATDTSGFLADPVSVSPGGSFGPNQLAPPRPGEVTLLERRAFNTATLPDGVQIIETVVTDALAITSEPQGLTCIVDNTPPAVDVQIPALVSSPDVGISWTVTDTVGPIVLLEVIAGGQTRLVANDPASIGSSVLSLPACDAELGWTVRATDAAGHVGTASGKVRCDDRAPAIETISSFYKPEATFELTPFPDSIVFSGENTTAVDITTGGMRLDKYRVRYYGGGPNMPVLTFEADDFGSVFTAPDDLAVAYRYSFSLDGTSWTVRRDWAPVERGTDYRVELSPENLSFDILTDLPTDHHRVTLRARDEAGNESTFEYRFQLRLIQTPLVFSGCDVADEIQRATLKNRTMSDYYDGSRREVFGGYLSWPIDPVYPYPWPYAMQATLSGATATTQVPTFSEARKLSDARTGIYESPTWCTVSYPAHRTSSCAPGLATPGNPWVPIQAAEHPIAYELELAGTSMGIGPSHTLARTSIYELHVFADTLELRDAVSLGRFAWPIIAGQHSYHHVSGYDVFSGVQPYPHESVYEVAHYDIYRTIHEVRVSLTRPTITAKDPVYPDHNFPVAVLLDDRCVPDTVNYITTPTTSYIE